MYDNTFSLSKKQSQIIITFGCLNLTVCFASLWNCSSCTCSDWDTQPGGDNWGYWTTDFGCRDGGATDYTTILGDGPDGIIACNYDPDAIEDDGSCEYNDLCDVC